MKHADVLTESNRPVLAELALREPSNSTEQSANLHRNFVPVPGAELSIIVPTFNERENVVELIRSLDKCLTDCSWEVIFVDDDSPDATSDFVRQLAQQDSRVRCLQRIGRRGLSSACVEGMLASSAPFLAVMDGDLQHDETLLVPMLQTLKTSEKDVVIGSRYVFGGGTGTWDLSRARMSSYATFLSRLIVRADLKDPMSGFFMIRREVFSAAVRNLSEVGFKILLDIFASSPTPLRFQELPYQFRIRQAGESKFDARAKWDYGMLLLDKLIGHVVPVRFVAFTLVGGIGVFIHLLTLTLLFKGLSLGFIESQGTAALVAMTGNFALNNVFTYCDVRLSGWHWLRGWAVFTMACSVGALANIGVAAYLFERNTGWTISAIAGILIGAVWNYATTNVYTWQGRGR
jgi:dolichol-phosphate mannosyltransferase